MKRLAQLIAVSLMSLAIPFTAWGLSTGADVQQDRTVWDIGIGAPVDVPPGTEPPECKLEVGEDGAQRTACCWILYFGRWWCIAC
jgi:hypothetical protein